MRDKNADLEKLADAFFKNLQRGNCEYGGWGLDDKRPFGNSSVECDILEIIGWESEGDEYSREQEDYATEIYEDLGAYLQEQWQKRKPPVAGGEGEGGR